MLALYALTSLMFATTAVAYGVAECGYQVSSYNIWEYSGADSVGSPFHLLMNATQQADVTPIDSGGYIYTVPIIEQYFLHQSSYEQIAQGIYHNAQNGICDAGYVRFDNATDPGGDPSVLHWWEAAWYSNDTYDVHPKTSSLINPWGSLPCQNLKFSLEQINQTVADCIVSLNSCGVTHGCCTILYTDVVDSNFGADYGKWSAKVKITANPDAHPADSLKCIDGMHQLVDVEARV